MVRPLRVLASAAALAVIVIPLGACETNSYSSKCDTDNSCEVTMSGTKLNDYPRPFDSGDGVESKPGRDKIRIVSATAGGEATLEADGDEYTCTEGSSFQVVDTTITCEVVGDEEVELTSTRP